MASFKTETLESGVEALKLSTNPGFLENFDYLRTVLVKETQQPFDDIYIEYDLRDYLAGAKYTYTLIKGTNQFRPNSYVLTDTSFGSIVFGIYDTYEEACDGLYKCLLDCYNNHIKHMVGNLPMDIPDKVEEELPSQPNVEEQTKLKQQQPERDIVIALVSGIVGFLIGVMI